MALQFVAVHHASSLRANTFSRARNLCALDSSRSAGLANRVGSTRNVRANSSWQAMSWVPFFRRGARRGNEQKQDDHDQDSSNNGSEDTRKGPAQGSHAEVMPPQTSDAKTESVSASAVAAISGLESPDNKLSEATATTSTVEDEFRGSPERAKNQDTKSSAVVLSQTRPGKILVWILVVCIGCLMTLFRVVKYVVAALQYTLKKLGSIIPAFKVAVDYMFMTLLKFRAWAFHALRALVMFWKNVVGVMINIAQRFGKKTIALPSMLRPNRGNFQENGNVEVSVKTVRAKVGAEKERMVPKKSVRAADVMLVVMRHAKCEEEIASTNPKKDFDRILSESGRADAISTGKQLHELGWVPDAMICSGAARTRQTMELLQDVFKDLPPERTDIPLIVDNDMYIAMETDEIRGIFQREQVEQQLARGCRVVLVGHNPGIERLVEDLTGIHVQLKQASAALLHLQPEFTELNVQGWRNFLGMKWKLVQVIEPN